MIEKKIKTQCKKCNHPIEIIDMKGLIYTDFCENCGYETDLDYFEDPKDGESKIMSRKDALKIGATFDCPNCGQDMTKEEKEEEGICIVCQSTK